MSDIPVGSPPVPPGRHAAPGGWYPDPVDSTQERYWDGWQWSRNTRAREGGVRDFSSVYPAAPLGQPYPQPYGEPQQAPQLYQPSAVRGAAQAAFTADEVPLAGWWWRVLACLVDSLVVGLLVLIPAFPLYQKLMAAISAYMSEVIRAAQAGQTSVPTTVLTNGFTPQDQLALLAIQLGVTLLFHVVFLRWKAATPGLMVCGLRVVPLDQGRYPGRLAWPTIILRVAVWMLPGASGFLWMIRIVDVVFPLWQRKRQTLHDIAAKTQVVKIR